ncbi:MAG TPA: beta-ketoacyl-ACP synthase III [Oculatellaceae cyanobacterium]|jgi:3-oxoacyl-[acyl-carrier-protein] synthase-3
MSDEIAFPQGNGKSPAGALGYGVQMVGIGAHVPSRCITNDDIAALVETSDEWITSRTGIRTRHVVSGDESVADLAIEAAKQALASAGMEGSDIELIIVASSTPDTIYPAVACQVQTAIGATRAAGFDMAVACSGFVYALVVAQQFLRTGMCKTALVIGADIHSRYLNWHDRNTCILFGDGAGAAILKAERGAEENFLASDLHLDGNKGGELTLFTQMENCPLVEPKTGSGDSFIHMNGREVFKFTVGVVPGSIQAACHAAGLALQDLEHVVLHQANIRIMHAMSEKLGIPEERLIANLDRYGNTGAASIPIALNEAVLEGKVKPGDKLLLCGFGAGFAWGTTILRWTAVDQRLPQSLKAEMQKRADALKSQRPVNV